MAHDIYPGRVAVPRLPVIGLTCYVEPVDRGVWRAQRSSLVPQDYVAAVQAAGGFAVLVPPRPDLDPDMADGLIRRLDALVITGGADMAPQTYGRTRHEAVQHVRPDRDHAEILLVRRARALGLPLLGVCRGMQVMAVEAGGWLHQHLPDRVGHTEHCLGDGRFGQRTVTLVTGTRLASLLGESTQSHCYHHQAVAEHPGYVAAGHDADGTLEAMEAPGDRFCLGVQWHPETGDDRRLFEGLVAAARCGEIEPKTR